jgi:hypothetical protein
MYLLQLAKECTMRINTPVIKFLQIGDENYNTDYGTEASNISKLVYVNTEILSNKVQKPQISPNWYM